MAHGAAALLLAGAGLGPFAAHAQNAIWVGTDPVYHDANNWIPHEVPSVVATFNGDAYPQVNITEATTIEAFSFEGISTPPTINVIVGGTLTLHTDSIRGGISNSTDSQVTVNISGPLISPSLVTLRDSYVSTAAGSAGSIRFNVSNGNSLIFTGESTADTKTTVNLQGTQSVLDLTGQTTLQTTIGGLVTGSTGQVRLGTSALRVTDDSSTAVVFAGTVSGPGQFIKDGTSTYVLTGNSTQTGRTNIQKGTIQLGDGGSSGSLSSDQIFVASVGKLIFNRSDDVTISSVLNGSGEIVKVGDNTTTITATAAATRTGQTTIEAGTLQVGDGHTTGTIGTGAVTNNGTLKFNRSDDFTASNAISGTGALVQAGTGTLTLTGNNTYSGETRIDSGTLQVGTGALGTLGTGAVTNNGTLKFNRSDDVTAANAISGTGALVKAGAATLTLTGTNTYSGETRIDSGILQIGDGGLTGTLGTGDVTNNGSLTFNRLDSLVVSNGIGGTGSVTQLGAGTTILTADNTYSGATIIDGGTLQVGNGGSTGTLGTGAITNNGTLAFNRSDSLTVAATIGGTGAVSQVAGTTILSGNNSYSGGTTIAGGTLRVSADGNLGAATGGITFSGANGTLRTTASMTTARDITLDASGRLDVDSGTTLTAGGNITGAGGLSKTGSGTLVLAGSNNFDGELGINSGTVSVVSSANVGSSAIRFFNGSTLQATGSFALANNMVLDTSGGTLQVAAGQTLTASGVISGSNGLSNDLGKTGAGTLILTGSNSYTGVTRLNAGTLVVSTDSNLGNGGGLIFGGGTLRYDAGFASGRAVTLNTAGLLDTNDNDAALTGTINGPGQLIKVGGGTLTLGGTNTYVGGTRIAGGTIAITSDANLGAASGGVLMDGGTLRTAGSFAVNRNIELLDGGGRFEVGMGTVTLTGNLMEGDGPGSLTKTGAGTLVLAGTTTYGGGTTVSAGTLQGTTATLLGDITNNATVSFNQTGDGTYAGVMSGSGGLFVEGTGTVTLTGANSYSGGTTVSGGTLQGTTTSLKGNILNNAAVAFNQSTDGTYAGALSGSGAVLIGGGGALTFTGANSYTGATTIASGSKLNIGNGGTLGTGAMSNNGELHFSQGDTLTVSASISGSGEVFLEEDSGTTIFTGSNSYTGPTRIWSGSTLQVGAGGTSGTLGAGPADVNNGTLRFDRSDTLVVTGEISGTNGNVVQAGSGTTALTFDSIYRGTTTIEAGTLKLGNGGSSGSLGPGNIVNNATLAFDRTDAMLTVAGEISGTGGIVQAGSGSTTLTGANSYSGTTSILTGRLVVGGTAGSLGTGNVVNDGVLHYTRTNAYTVANDISGTGSFRLFGGGTGTLTGNNTYTGTTIVGTGTLRVGDGGTVGTLGTGDIEMLFGRLEFNRSNALTVAGAISGAGTVAQVGTGTTSLTGNGTLTGTTTISAGTLSLGDGGATGALGTGNITNNATLQFNRSNALTVANAISGTGNVVQGGTGTTYLTRNNTYTGTTTISAGTLSIGNGGTTGSIGTGNVINNATLQINRSDNVTFANAIGGAGSLVQAGPGTTILTGANSYSGGTTVSGGTLQGTTASLQGNVLNNAAVVFSQAANGTYTGNMSGTGSLTLTGGGQYTLTGTNSYTGGTSLLAGALIGNSASLQGNILNNGAVTFSQSGSGTYAGNMSGSGSMTLQGGGTLAMTGSSTYTGPTTVNASTLIVNGSLASTVSVSNGGVLAGSGNIGAFVSTGGILAPGNSIGTMTINGNFTQNGGTYVVEANAQGQSDRVNVKGTATINGASVQVVAAPGNYSTSTTYTILNATGGVSGTYTGVATDYAFMTPSLSYDANNVFLTLALQGNAFSGFGGNTANQRGVGYALDQSYTGASGDFAAVIGALANLGTAQASPTLNMISGQPYADFGSFNVANNALFMNTLGQQMALARGSSGSGQRQALAQACDVAACDGASPFSVWGSVLGGLGSVQGDGNASTFTYNVGGTAAGIDYRVSPNVLVGLGAGYTSGTQWVDGFQGKGWANTVSVAAYGSFTQSGFYADVLAGYAYSNNQLQRQIAIPGLQQRTANGSTGVNQFLGQAELGYKLGVHAPAQATVTPFARFQASSINQAAFSEWGANSLNLNVAQQTTTSLRTVLGADLAGAIGLGNTRTLDLGLRLGWLHEYANTARPMTAAFAGAPAANFTVFGATPQRDSAVIGFQAGTDVAAGTKLYLRYDGEVGATANTHALNLGVRLTW